MLEFAKITIESKPLIDSYYYKYGERSCQHSFATNFCLNAKYKDIFVEKDGVLYISREGLDDDNYRTYLFPMCDRNDRVKLRKAVEEIIEDARYYNKKVRFFTITKECKDILYELYQDRFIIEGNRDLYEYIFTTERIATLPGRIHQSKRNLINKLYKTYEDKIVIKTIEDADKEEIRKMYMSWIDDHTGDDVSILQNEMKEFDLAIDNYEKLNMIGIVIYIEGMLAGFNFGSIISNDTYDGMVQKGNIDYNGIYELLNKETAILIKDKIKYMNFEEDLGIEGLRKAKLIYDPEYMIEKYIATEA